MVNLITEHIDIWTAAQIQKTNGGRGRGRNSNGQSPHGIKKLRELILELAVRGKLVPQDPNDEPASVFLERITKEKKRLIKEGKIKKQKPLPEISGDEKPFELTDGWEWAQLGNLSANIHYGYTAPADYGKFGVRLLRITDIQNDSVNWETVPGCEIEEHKANDYLLENDDILIARTGGTIGKSYLVENIDIKAVFASYLIRVKRIEGMYSPFIKTFLGSQLYWQQLYEHSMGTGQPNVNATALKGLVFPIPPLAEQHRIVAKVDELMALCDQLELQQTDSNATHQTLLETLLATLTTSANQRESAEAWQRIANHFDTLLTTEQSIDQLKQTILQLAVMGNLAPQDPNNEPASVLLEKIAKEKTQLIKEDKIKKQKFLPKINEDEKPFDLPNGWEWTRIGNASIFTEYGMSEKTFDGINGIPVLKMGDIQGGKVIIGGQKLVPENVAGLPSLYLKKWDLLYNRTNSAELVGKTGIYDGPDDAYTFASYLIRIRCSKECLHPKYLNLYMNTPLFRATQIEPHLKQQCGQANVNGTIMRNMIVPVPPIKEQHRIVAKADEMMALCNTLKAGLNNAQTIQVQLADVIVEQAVV